MLVPPARNFACGLAAIAAAAPFGSVARVYLNGRIRLLLPHPRELLLVHEPPRLRRLLARVHFLDRSDDPGIRAAPADVPLIRSRI
jgi:hypothetical protein